MRISCGRLLLGIYTSFMLIVIIKLDWTFYISWGDDPTLDQVLKYRERMYGQHLRDIRGYDEVSFGGKVQINDEIGSAHAYKKLKEKLHQETADQGARQVWKHNASCIASESPPC